ncbi:hypothetical protein D3C81_1260890 [compost metagenome]
MDHAVDVVVQADEQAELGGVLDFAFDGRTDRVSLDEGFPRVVLGLLQAQRDAALGAVDVQDDDFHFLRGGDDLARVDVLLGPGHFRNVDQAFDAGFQLNERTVIGDVRDAARVLGVDRVLGFDAVPRIRLPSEMRWVSGLILTIWTLTVSPTARTCDGCETRFHDMSVTCSRPSMPPRSTNAP